MAQVAAEVRSLRGETVSPYALLHPMHDGEPKEATPATPKVPKLTLAEQGRREQAMWIASVQGQLDAAKKIKATREAGRKGAAKK